ncbi:hypothetical protein HZH68_013946 [Vespula germanica]|uniref:KN homeodomain domain-containing protein n=1 Tax=Vespula germanica TaxID=30212 RepID=A0A834JHD3_VESGE|nr:hypothetical protein HZH68_013946 [Vespula germanica]
MTTSKDDEVTGVSEDIAPLSCNHYRNSTDVDSIHLITSSKRRLCSKDNAAGWLRLFLSALVEANETKRPSKEMQVTIARQLGLEPTTVGNFFMNARRRSMDKWKDEDPKTVAVEEGQLSPTIGIGQRQPSDVL